MIPTSSEEGKREEIEMRKEQKYTAMKTFLGKIFELREDEVAEKAIREASEEFETLLKVYLNL